MYQKTIVRLVSVKTFPSLLFLCQCLVIVAKFCFKSKIEQINELLFPPEIIKKPWFFECSVTYECLEIIYTLNLKKKKNNFMAPFSGWGSTASRLELLQGGSLLFTTKFPGISGTHFTDLGRMKGWVNLGATQWFWTRDLWIGNPAPWPLDTTKNFLTE